MAKQKDPVESLGTLINQKLALLNEYSQAGQAIWCVVLGKDEEKRLGTDFRFTKPGEEPVEVTFYQALALYYQIDTLGHVYQPEKVWGIIASIEKE